MSRYPIMEEDPDGEWVRWDDLVTYIETIPTGTVGNTPPLPLAKPKRPDDTDESHE